MTRLLRQIGVESAYALCSVKRADNLAQHPDYHGRQAVLDEAEALITRIVESDKCFSLRQLAVDGNDMLSLGLRGREIGQALELLLSAVMDGDLPNEKESLINEVKRTLVIL